METIPRKMELSEVEKAACAQVAALRRSLGLSVPQFARQVGCSVRTLYRWERGLFCPRPRSLARLAQLKEMNEHLDDEMRRSLKESSKKRPALMKLAWDEVRLIQAGIAVRLLERVGAEGFERALTFTAAEIGREKNRKVQVRLDTERDVFHVWVTKRSGK